MENLNVRPDWSRKWLADEDLSTIESSVRKAELTTSAEIVPMIINGSSVRGHLFALALLMISIVFILLDVFLWETNSASWWMILFQLVVTVTLARWLEAQDFALRFFTSDDDLQSEVELRAQVEFYKAGLNKTSGSTGILLFVSLAERRAVILADHNIATKVPKETWNEVVSILIDGIRKSGLKLGFERAIEKTSQITAPHFPLERNDANELSNRVRFKDQTSI